MLSERAIVVIVAAVQFVNILDFMMVMPLGPDFAAALDIPTSYIGLLGGSYTASAAVSGMLGSFVLDRFDRRRALGAAMLGLVFATALGGFASGLWSLLAARVIAGAFGGPATSMSLAIVTDAVPPARRGRAVGAVMASFSLASILGVPVGLELAEWFGWRAPFFGVAALGVLVVGLALFLLPSMRAHLSRTSDNAAERRLLDPLAKLSLCNTALVMLSVFAVVPNISAFLQHNLGYPREHLGVLYLAGGAASFVASHAMGKLVDRFGATRPIAAGTLIFAVAIWLGFVDSVRYDHVIYVFILLMMSASVRGVPLHTLASRVPRAELRARFMSAQSMVQHVASALGASGAAFLLDAEPDGRLIGMQRVALAAIAFASLVPWFAFRLERGVVARERTAEARLLGSP